MIPFIEISRTGKYKDRKLTSGCQRREWVGWGEGVATANGSGLLSEVIKYFETR